MTVPSAILPSAERRAARVSLACRIYQARLDRARFFRFATFGDSGWDALLAIYVFSAAGRTLSAGELCLATSEMSATTSLRTQRRFVDLGLIRRIEHPTDRRCVLIELTEEGRRTLEDYLDHLLDHHVTPANDDGEPELIRKLHRPAPNQG
jgi:DNA-binding MarR family transcriptional regulator